MMTATLVAQRKIRLRYSSSGAVARSQTRDYIHPAGTACVSTDLDAARRAADGTRPWGTS
eukprot:7193526-Alexandrium_andersonii.AAC.1